MSEDVIATTSASENVYFKFKATDNEDRPFSAETTSSQYLSSRSSGGEEATYSCQFFKLGGDMREGWHRLMTDDGDCKRAESEEHAFQDDDLVGVLRCDVARAVVLEASADRRRNDKQRAIREPEAVRSLEREQDARKRD